MADEQIQVSAKILRFSPDARGGNTTRLVRDETFMIQRDVYEKATKADPEAQSQVQAAVSNILESDAKFQDDFLAGRTLAPPLPLQELAGMLEESSVLGPCIEAMEINVEGFGFELEPLVPDEQRENEEVVAERKTLEQFFETVNPRLSFAAFRKRLRRDYESIGNAYIEVVRAPDGKAIVWLEHLPGADVRLAQIDKNPQTVDIAFLTQSGEITTKAASLRFRRYIQIVGRSRVWFKEFGDPRQLNARTGKFAKDGQEIPYGERATEVIHWSQYNSRGPYGLPRYVGNIPSVRGARYAELVNVNYFQKNAIPPMVILVSGGELTEESKRRVEKSFREGAGGLDNYHAAVVLEAKPFEAGLSDRGGGISIAMKPLQSERMNEAHFLRYDESCIQKVRSSFRLPKLYTGREDVQNRAVAEAARVTAEEQVFVPERSLGLDDIINRMLFPAMGVKYHRFYTKGPMIADVAAFTSAVAAFDSVGAMTPNQAITIVNEFLGTDLEPFPDDWGDRPFRLTLAMVSAGQLNLGDAEQAAGATSSALQDAIADAEQRGIDPEKTGVVAKAADAILRSVDDLKRRRTA